MATKPQDESGSIPLENLSLAQIHKIYRQIKAELEVLSSNSDQLVSVVKKYQNSIQSVEQLAFIKNKILLPCTDSLYVNGRVSDNKDVIVDIGTGYYIQMTTQEAVRFFKRRIEYITEQLKSLDSMLLEKSNILPAVEKILVSKIQQDEISSKVQQAKIS